MATTTPNMDDRRVAGRNKWKWKNTNNHARKILTDEQVVEIRKRFQSGKKCRKQGNAKQLAEEFGVSPNTIRGLIQKTNRRCR